MVTRKKSPSATPAAAAAGKSSAAAAPPIEVDAASAPPLGMNPREFLRDYWQKRPLLIRNAFPGFVSPIEPEDLAGLACEEGTLARIVEHDRARDAWTLRTGPFDEAMFPDMPHEDWTLLVQDMDKWDADIARLLEAFDFLPRWRIDDVMVSFAAPGGSVGAHVDQYDVFLLQAQGHRRWQIDASPNPPTGFRDDVELKLLSRFSPTHEWVLGPGDMLYLPPGVPHHGVAEDACLTFSVGMRAPSAAELLGDFVDTLAADADEALRYQDPDLAPATDPAQIDDAAMARAVAALNALRMNDPDRLGDWFGRFVTLYRNAGEVLAAPEPRSRIEVEWDLQQGGGLQRHPWSRMAWRKSGKQARLYVNGEDHTLPVRDAKCVANSGELDGPAYAALSQAGRDCVFELLQAGHYRLAGANDDHDGDGDEEQA
ncbi:cupin domain-containing protein [Agrilutibacter solisilvae]|uniref:Cupin domain-containing protein n=1 Tax=Agrilutibacter solisilvae TaxID=2763317 RepID=A0A974XYU0_9GAMM|nr:cupin domain-containing protein [Lysobacter solisilvae]QSX77403.1 cupin domain-containing protein [Lysobacter solisilvae]